MFNKKMFILILLLFVQLFNAKTNLNFNAQFVANAKNAGLFNANA